MATRKELNKYHNLSFEEMVNRIIRLEDKVEYLEDENSSLIKEFGWLEDRLEEE